MKLSKDIRDLLLCLLIAISVIFIFQTCSKDSNPTSSGDCPNGRSGAVCNDGTTSSATGSGACSKHGGVNHWLCK